MALTYTLSAVRESGTSDGFRIVKGIITCAGTYVASGGGTGVAAALASYLTVIDAILCVPSANGYIAAYQVASDKLMIQDYDSEVANSEANTEAFRFVAFGSRGTV